MANYLDYYIKKFGPSAEKAAADLFIDKPPFVIKISDEEFEKRLKGPPQNSTTKSYEQFKQQERH